LTNAARLKLQPREIMNSRLALGTTFVALLGLALAGWSGRADLVRLNIDSESLLQVSGTSTVHAWTCGVETFEGAIEADPAAAPASSLVEALTRVQVTVPIAGLECRNGTMNKKAHEALGGKSHPTIQYALTSARVASIDADGWTVLDTAGRLTIGGAERPIQMLVRGLALPDGRYRFTGSVSVKMSDFDVKPPTAMLGTMRTGDAVDIEFDVQAR
jgi:polyisoprenoid-binding protein YceI